MSRSGAGTACEPRYWGLRWSSLWGRETCARCADSGVEPPAKSAAGTCGGAPYGAIKTVRGWQTS
eukprot:2749724-Pyramimonas_sp.AAC.1